MSMCITILLSGIEGFLNNGLYLKDYKWLAQSKYKHKTEGGGFETMDDNRWSSLTT
jgi:hypothetical protein